MEWQGRTNTGRLVRPVKALLAVLLMCAFVASCSSGSGSAHGSSTTIAPPSTAVIATSTTSPASSPTVRIAHWTGRKPVTIYFSDDSGDIATKLTWSRWSGDGAAATGTWHYQNCVPDCAEGSWTPYPVTIALSRPVNGQFTKLVEQTSGPHGYTMTFTAPHLGQGACTNQSASSCS
jgi:hypothetical protein